MFERVPSHNPQRDLWQSVLLTSIEDALLGPAQVLTPDSRLRACKAARAYLTRTSNDLDMVCELAGFEMASLVQIMRAKIAKAPTPEELVSRPRRLAAALHDPKPPKPQRVPFADQVYTVQGKNRTAAEWCERFDVPLLLAQARLNRGWTPERALTMTKAEAISEALAIARQFCRRSPLPAQTKTLRAPSNSTPRYTHAGESLTLAQWADRAGLKKGTLVKRLRSGMTLSKALAPCSSVKRRPMRDLARDVGGARVHKQPGNDIIAFGNTHLLAVREAEQALIVFRGCDADDLSNCNRGGVAATAAAQQVEFNEAHDGSLLGSETDVQPQQRQEGPGVGVNLCSLPGTGGGRSAHDLPNLGFTPVAPVKSEIPA